MVAVAQVVDAAVHPFTASANSSTAAAIANGWLTSVTQWMQDPTTTVFGRFITAAAHGMLSTITTTTTTSGMVFWIAVVLGVVLVMMVGTLIWLKYIRYQTRRQLERCGLPTVYWTPRLWWWWRKQAVSSSSPHAASSTLTPTPNNQSQLLEQVVLSSSSIINILPRMQRLQGPYGMYGTVYGLSTPVIHMAHPVPIQHVLVGGPASVGGGQSQKAPAYNHFTNFCGHGVFTADGADWKAKRAAVLHALFARKPSLGNRPSTTTTTTVHYEERLLTLANQSAHALIQTIQLLQQQRPQQQLQQQQQQQQQDDEETRTASCSLNIVPLLQQSTVGLIFQYTTGSTWSEHVIDDNNNEKITMVSSGPPQSRNPQQDRCQTTKTMTTTTTKHIMPHGKPEPDATTNLAPCKSSPTPSRSIVSPSTSGLVASSVLSSSSSSLSSSSSSTSTVSTLAASCTSTPSVSSAPPPPSSSPSSSAFLKLYLESITRIRMILLAQSRSIWFLLPSWCYRTFSNLYQQEEEVLQPIRALAHYACVVAQPGSPLAMLQALPLYQPQAQEKKQRPETDRNRSNDADHDGKRRSNNTVSPNLLHEAITLLFAGQDTTAATLSWTLHLLSLYPHIQQKLYQEVQHVILEQQQELVQQQEEDKSQSNNGNSNDKKNPEATGSLVLDKKVLSRMTYLDAVLKEAMRLYPVAPFVVRRLGQDLPIPMMVSNDDKTDNNDKNITTVNNTISKNGSNTPPSSSSKQATTASSTTLPKGAFACIWIYAMHRNPHYWHRPNDFCPERWLVPEEGDEDKRPRDRGITEGAYMPFARGPRNCLGQPFAHLVLRTLLAHLMYRFSFCDERLLEQQTAAKRRQEQQQLEQSHSPKQTNPQYQKQQPQQPQQQGANTFRSGRNHKNDSNDDGTNDVAYGLRKDMQAGFTVLPQNGVMVKITSRF
ncbi:hypothetical protein ACA910_011903 [Epithemia clementina (nom. ined.)]